MSESLLPEIWEVPQEFRDRLGSSPGRQRAMFADGHLLLVLHEPPEPDEKAREGRFFWRSPEGEWKSNQPGSGTGSLDQHLAEYDQAAVTLERMENEAQDAEDYFAAIEAAGPLRRASRNLHATLQDARKYVPEDRRIIDWRDRAYQLERTIELQYEVTKNSLDFAVAKRAEEQAAAGHSMSVSAHRLNLLAAFFFPIATISGIFGVNMKTGLEEIGEPWLFLSTMGAGLLCGVLLTSFVTRPDITKAKK